MQKILEKLTTIENLLKGQTEKPLTFNEAARYLDVSKSYLYQLTCKQRIPHYKPQGKRVYFIKSELDKWIMRKRVRSINEIEEQAEDYINNGGAK